MRQTKRQILETQTAAISQNLSDFQDGWITYGEFHRRQSVAHDAIAAAGMREEFFRQARAVISSSLVGR